MGVFIDFLHNLGLNGFYELYGVLFSPQKQEYLKQKKIDMK